MTNRSRCGVLAAMALLLIVVLVTGTAQTIRLPREVPSFNQAYNDGPDAWGECPLGTIGCPDQVCTTGCLITAFASVLAYYEIDVTVPAASSCTGLQRTGMDPGIFNDWLRHNGGYGRCSQDPVGNCCLVWEDLPDGLEISTHVNRSEVGLNPVASVVIDHALRQGYPIIAGVHWGASCNGPSTQSEDCHWVILTGKLGEVYTIVDPFNPDPSSPVGVRTTLDAGVHGSYIIDRFVIVSGPMPGDIKLAIDIVPDKPVYSVTDPLALSLRTPDSSVPLLPFARVTAPSGTVLYVVADPRTPSQPRLVSDRISMIEQPRSLADGFAWYDRELADADVGFWSWEVWVERAEVPGTKLGRQLISYDVLPSNAARTAGVAVVGVLAVLVVAAVAFATALGFATD